MHVFEAKPREWGNSLGITLPSEVVKGEGLSPDKKMTVIVLGKQSDIKDIFGTLKLKKPTQKIMNEIDEEYD